jgi:hypothetical protein
MKFIWLGALSAFIVPMSILGQQLSSAEKSVADAARAKYYNLEKAGFQSLACSVKFDFATVPLLSHTSDDPTRKLLESTSFGRVLDGKGRLLWSTTSRWDYRGVETAGLAACRSEEAAGNSLKLNSPRRSAPVPRSSVAPSVDRRMSTCAP